MSKDKKYIRGKNVPGGGIRPLPGNDFGKAITNFKGGDDGNVFIKDGKEDYKGHWGSIKSTVGSSKILLDEQKTPELQAPRNGTIFDKKGDVELYQYGVDNAKWVEEDKWKTGQHGYWCEVASLTPKCKGWDFEKNSKLNTTDAKTDGGCAELEVPEVKDSCLVTSDNFTASIEAGETIKLSVSTKVHKLSSAESDAFVIIATCLDIEYKELKDINLEIKNRADTYVTESIDDTVPDDTEYITCKCIVDSAIDGVKSGDKVYVDSVSVKHGEDELIPNSTFKPSEVQCKGWTFNGDAEFNIQEAQEDGGCAKLECKHVGNDCNTTNQTLPLVKIGETLRTMVRYKSLKEPANDERSLNLVYCDSKGKHLNSHELIKLNGNTSGKYVEKTTDVVVKGATNGTVERVDVFGQLISKKAGNDFYIDKYSLKKITKANNDKYCYFLAHYFKDENPFGKDTCKGTTQRNPKSNTNKSINSSPFGAGYSALSSTSTSYTAYPLDENKFAFKGNWTIDFWVYLVFNGTNTYGSAVMGTWKFKPDSKVWHGWYIVQKNNSLRFRGVRSYDMQISKSVLINNITHNKWHHIEIGKYGKDFYGFLNGKLSTKVNDPLASNLINHIAGLYVGRTPEPATSFDCNWKGRLAELRITQGICRHTTNFIPEAHPYSDKEVIGDELLVNSTFNPTSVVKDKFRIPDDRGRFFRNIGVDQAGVGSNRDVGSLQKDSSEGTEGNIVNAKGTEVRPYNVGVETVIKVTDDSNKWDAIIEDWYHTYDTLTGEYIDTKKYKFPPYNSTQCALPKYKDGFARVLDTDVFTYVENHRNEEVYSKEDGTPFVIKNLGPIPDKYTSKPRPYEYSEWDAKTNDWVDNKSKKKEYLKQKLIAEYMPDLDNLKSSLAAAFALDDQETLSAIKVMYVELDKEFKEKMKKIDNDNINEDELKHSRIFCPVCGKLLMLDKNGKHYCEVCGWKEK